VAVAYKIRAAKKKAKERAQAEHKAQFMDAFKKYDEDGTGKLCKDEVSAAIADVNGEPPSEQELEFVMRQADAGSDGRLGPEEFAEALDAWQCYLDDFKDPNSEMNHLFNEFDTDNDGQLDKTQLAKLLASYTDGKEVPEKEVDAVMMQAGGEDGQINKMELRLAVATWFQRSYSSFEGNVEEDDVEENLSKEGANKKRGSAMCAVL